MPPTPSSPSCLVITEEKKLCEVRSSRRCVGQSKVLTPMQEPIESDGTDSPVPSRRGRKRKATALEDGAQTNVVAVKVRKSNNVLTFILFFV